MGYWLDEPRRRQAAITARTLRAAIALSLLVHGAALFVVLHRTGLRTPDEGQDQQKDRLEVRLAAPPRVAPVQVPEPAREIVAFPRPQARPPRVSVHTPPVIASTIEAPRIPALPPPAPPSPPAVAPAPTTPPVEGDLWSYIQARRRERGAPEASLVESQDAERNANLAANLPRRATGAANADPKHGGGIFELRRMDYDDAAFLFFGWNKDMGRQTPQLIEVRKGNNPDMRIAVVRRMIAIIREYEQGDFVWRSPHHDRDLVLSARLSDNAELEAFLMREFFEDRHQP